LSISPPKIIGRPELALYSALSSPLRESSLPPESEDSKASRVRGLVGVRRSFELESRPDSGLQLKCLP